MKMNKMNRIKVRKRCMPETNSSSSHAVSISMGSNFVKPGDSDWDITIEDGILKIPGGVSFGWEYFRSNSVLTKLQYLCGIYCWDVESGNGLKRIKKKKKILKEIFGVKKVEFAWLTEYFKEIREEGKKPEDVYYAYPEIDHNSHDIFEDIIESKETIKHFLLSRDSWLFGGNDNSEMPEGFYNIPTKDTEPKVIASIELGGDYGRVDWEVIDFPIRTRQIMRTLTTYDDFDILGSICYNIETSKFEETNIPDGNAFKEYLETRLSVNNNLPLYKKSGKYYIIFSNHRFYDVYREFVKPGEQTSSKFISQTLEKLEEGKDYLLLQVKIKLLEYGGYYV